MALIFVIDLHLNTNSLIAKIDEIREILRISKVGILGITESKLDDSILDSEVSVEGYQIIRSDRNRNGGGVACYIREDFVFNHISPLSSELEYLMFDIYLPKTKPFCVGIFYRPPSQNNFLDILCEDFLKLDVLNKEYYILGDFNINLLIAGEYAPTKFRTVKAEGHHLLSRYRDFCTVFGLSQLIRAPTRLQALLDHVLTNCSEKITQSGIIDVGLSDHELIYCTRKVIKSKFNSKKQISYCSMKSYTKEKFLELLRLESFPEYDSFTDVNVAYQDFMGRLSSVINNIAPMREVRVKQGSPEWFDGEILEKIKLRNKLLRKYKKSRLQIDRNFFTEARNSVQKLIREKKKSFFEEKLKENVGKPRELWKTLKSLGLGSKSSGDSNISLKKADGDLTSSPTQTANLFKDFYANLADDLLKLLPNPKNVFGIASAAKFYQKKVEGKSFSLTGVENEVINKILHNLAVSKAPGIDNVASLFLKDGAEILCDPITRLINLSIKLASFPDEAKTAKIKPLFKKSSRLDPKNYRPISLLPILSKVFERVVHDQTQAFLEGNKLFYEFQSGFRKNHSTNFCLSYLNDKITRGFDSGQYTGMILIDLQKAFDTIDYSILFEKLKALNFSIETVDWFKSYLRNRKFCVSVGQSVSDFSELKCGVPQGSISWDHCSS